MIGKSRSKSSGFVREGDDFSSKHSVSPARDESFQLQEILDGTLVGCGRSGHGCTSAKMVHLELAREFRISQKVLRFVVFFEHG